MDDIVDATEILFRRFKRNAEDMLGIREARRLALGKKVVTYSGIFLLGLIVGWTLRGNSNSQQIKKVVS
jgi:hypothetical protein